MIPPSDRPGRPRYYEQTVAIWAVWSAFGILRTDCSWVLVRIIVGAVSRRMPRAVPSMARRQRAILSTTCCLRSKSGSNRGVHPNRSSPLCIRTTIRQGAWPHSDLGVPIEQLRSIRAVAIGRKRTATSAELSDSPDFLELVFEQAGKLRRDHVPPVGATSASRPLAVLSQRHDALARKNSGGTKRGVIRVPVACT